MLCLHCESSMHEQLYEEVWLFVDCELIAWRQPDGLIHFLVRVPLPKRSVLRARLPGKRRGSRFLERRD